MKAYAVSKKLLFVLSVILLMVVAFSPATEAQTESRTEIKIPDILGYRTLKCDFHTHTVFSNGTVWPFIRSEEIWQEGLDAFAITDHVEYTDFEKDIPKNLNRAHELALPSAAERNIIIIKGAEISRSMPPGHFNAIFLNDIDPLTTEEYEDAIKAAVDQRAFLFWNHPGGGQPERKAVWYQEHTDIYEKGWMHGIEVVNRRNYYPNAHKWALEKKLTMLGNSDLHYPSGMRYDLQNGEHRTMTLVFAKDKTPDAIKEALIARRTVVYAENTLIGEEQYLKPIFCESIKILNPDLEIRGQSRAYVQIRNDSDVSYELVRTSEPESISVPENITLLSNKTVLLAIRGKSETLSGSEDLSLGFTVKNLWIAPEEGLHVEIKLEVTFVPVES